MSRIRPTYRRKAVLFLRENMPFFGRDVSYWMVVAVYGRPSYHKTALNNLPQDVRSYIQTLI